VSTSVERALDVLKIVGSESPTARELARKLGVHEATVSRLVQTLESEGFVKREDDRRIRLGSTMFTLAQRALDDLDIRRVAAEHLGRLNAVTGHTIHLAQYEAGTVMYIDKLESLRPVRMYSRIGGMAPLYCTGVGKVIVAFRPIAEQRTLVAGTTFVRHTAHTVAGPAEFLGELRLIRERGYATDQGEHEDAIRCIAAPIREADGSVRNCVSVSALVMDADRLADYVPVLLETTGAISRELGWSGSGVSR
jgi:DNA-binding IclR family transcriptional regulator